MKVIKYVDKNTIENIKSNVKNKEEQINILIKLLEWCNHEHLLIFNKKHKTRKELKRLKVLEDNQCTPFELIPPLSPLSLGLLFWFVLIGTSSTSTRESSS